MSVHGAAPTPAFCTTADSLAVGRWTAGTRQAAVYHVNGLVLFYHADGVLYHIDGKFGTSCHQLSGFCLQVLHRGTSRLAARSFVIVKSSCDNI